MSDDESDYGSDEGEWLYVEDHYDIAVSGYFVAFHIYHQLISNPGRARGTYMSFAGTSDTRRSPS